MRNIIKWFSISVTVLIIIADIIFLFYDDTISKWLHNEYAINNLWIIPYYTCVLPGHWWINIWRIDNPWLKDWAIFRYLLLAGVGVLTLYLNLSILKEVYIPWYVTIPGGLATGALLWPQPRVKK